MPYLARRTSGAIVSVMWNHEIVTSENGTVWSRLPKTDEFSTAHADAVYGN